MLKWLYPWEKLYFACSVAIGSAQRPQERLRAAAQDVSLLLHHEIRDEELRRRMEQFVANCNSKPSQGEGTLPATTSQMSDDEASDLLRELLDIFARVAELQALEAQHLH